MPFDIDTKPTTVQVQAQSQSCHLSSTTTTRIFTDRTYVTWEKNVICASVRTNFQFDSSQGRSMLCQHMIPKQTITGVLRNARQTGSLRRFNTTICVASRSCYTYHFYITFLKKNYLPAFNIGSRPPVVSNEYVEYYNKMSPVLVPYNSLEFLCLLLSMVLMQFYATYNKL